MGVWAFLVLFLFLQFLQIWNYSPPRKKKNHHRIIDWSLVIVTVSPFYFASNAALTCVVERTLDLMSENMVLSDFGKAI